MSLLKIFRGLQKDLDQVTTKVDGQVYLTTDTGNMYFDIDSGEETERIQLNAKAATEILSTAGTEVPKSAKYEDLFAKAYSGKLDKDSWTGGDSGPYTQKVELQTLTCGEDGTVPPIITLTGETNIDDYNKIEFAEATPNDGITFSCNEKPVSDISVIIIDLA